LTDLRIVFAGTPEFACPALRALIRHRAPVAVLTRPDRPAGRGRQVRYGPVKQIALDAGIEVLQPRSLRDDEAAEALAVLAPDLIVTAAYGLLLPRRVLTLPPHGCWNLHASLLPRWRGASPIQQAILAGDERTGVTLMQMDAGMDTGDLLMRAETGIEPEESAGALHDRLAGMAAALLIDALTRLTSGTLPEPRPQDPAQASHAPRIEKADARLNWDQDAEQLARRVRAYDPWPVAHATIAGQMLRVFRARADTAAVGDPPGRLVPGRRDAIRVACGSGVLDILELQAPGRKRVTAGQWLNAHPDWRR
jgi:methionyl-tRNA formyltransferase